MLEECIAEVRMFLKTVAKRPGFANTAVESCANRISFYDLTESPVSLFVAVLKSVNDSTDSVDDKFYRVQSALCKDANATATQTVALGARDDELAGLFGT